MQRTSRQSDIQFVVENEAYEAAVRSLHQALVEAPEVELAPAAA
jgi:hypothetical protein